MANRFYRNKELLGYCPNYYKIINEEFYEGDNISKKIIEIYTEYIFNIKYLSNENIIKLQKFDKIINKYFDNQEFKKELSKGLLKIKIKSSETNVLNYIVDEFILLEEEYMEGYTRNIYIPKWI